MPGARATSGRPLVTSDCSAYCSGRSIALFDWLWVLPCPPDRSCVCPVPFSPIPDGICDPLWALPLCSSPERSIVLSD